MSIGPIHHEVVTRQDVTAEGLTILKTEPLYKGRVLHLRCPVCELALHVAVDLAPLTLLDYITYQRDELAALKIDSIFKMNGAHCTLRAFPLDCPRCGRSIVRPNADRVCVDCGGTQVQLIQSEDIRVS